MITMSADTTATRALLARSPAALALALRATYNDASSLFLRELATYPPAPPRSTYKRTRTLGRAWSRQFSGAGLGLSVLIGNNGNMAPYNRRVQDRDRYGRTVAQVFVGERDVGLEMVRQGRAVMYEQYNDSPAYRQAQAEARQARRGIWEKPGGQQDPATWRRLNPR